MNEQAKWLRPEKAAPYLDLNVMQLYDKLRRGLLPPEIRVLRIGRQYRLNAADIGVVTTSQPTAESEQESLAA